MERRASIFVAAAVSASMLAAGTAFALAGGIATSDRGDGAGTLSPVSASVVDVDPSPSASPRDESSSEDEHDDDVDLGRPDEYEAHEYEGADDDD